VVSFTFGQQNSGMLRTRQSALPDRVLVLVLAPQHCEDGSVIWNLEVGIKESISKIVATDFTDRWSDLQRNTHRSTTAGEPASNLAFSGHSIQRLAPQAPRKQGETGGGHRGQTERLLRNAVAG
jgi:hypothetical protein